MKNRIEVIKNEQGAYEEREFVVCPLWYHTLGIQQTVTGYGMKLTTPFKVIFAGKLRRVYCRQYSNCGSLFVMLGNSAKFLGV